MADIEQTVARPEGARIGYAGGAFDLFHIGHLNILKHARSACDYLVAGVVADEALVATRGHGPIVPLSERLEIVRHISFVDEAYPETAVDKLETWNEVRFDIYFKGDDWKGTRRGRDLERAFAKVGVEVVYFPYTVTTSSTILRRALAALQEPDAPERSEGEG
ncbi:glycerol-3-phosphate cytidylyltransferase [Agromyces sp. 3263]|uniref:adenylyltransferase/cytidyltransferase family protein n=1 Tax=Agromyces sp. 3263 TaxID=2817750 RepID=UPI002858DDF9|nr:adenylyltransferase/cytidyltransferase family protein [Agromyces sp. 3263]MDR6906567.1 glycerol-3-phosphate cytidylyltransferase [Agromyces sp. 3263]